jgi:hypothetical protein
MVEGPRIAHLRRNTVVEDHQRGPAGCPHCLWIILWARRGQGVESRKKQGFQSPGHKMTVFLKLLFFNKLFLFIDFVESFVKRKKSTPGFGPSCA